jgi:hypothetical protein
MSRGSRRKLYASHFHPGLEEAFVEELSAAKKNDPLRELTVVCSSNLVSYHLQRTVASRVGSCMNVRFLTMVDLARRLAPGSRQLPAGADQIVLADVAGSAIPDDGGYFSAAKRTPGFARALSGTITDLREAGLSPEDLRLPGGRGAAKLRELEGLYAAYVGKLEASGLVDAAGLMTKAAECAGERASDTPIFFYGFYDLNGVQKRLVSAICEARPAILFVPSGSAGDMPFARPVLEWAASRGFQRVAVEPAAGSLPLPPSVEFARAPDEESEARAVMRKIMSLVREGYAFHEIGVLVRNPERRIPILSDAASCAGIPVYVPRGIRLSDTKPARSLALIGEMLRTGMSRESVVDFLNTADAPEGTTIEEIASDMKSVPERGTWKETASACESLLKKYVVPREKDAERAFEQVAGVLERLGGCDAAGVKATRELLLRSASSMLERASLRSRERFRQASVAVLPVMDARGLAFRAVIVPGMLEKEFPRAARQDPILLDGERRRVNERATAELPLKADAAEEERLLFSIVCGSALENLVFLHAASDPGTGAERVPSFFLTDARRALGREGEQPSAVEGTPVAESDYDIARAEEALAASDPGAVSYLREVSPTFARAVECENKRWGQARFTEYDGRLSSADALSILSDRFSLRGRAVSPSALEEYAGCPFKYFCERILEVRVPEEVPSAYGLDPLVVGNVAHDALRRLFAGMKKAGRLPLDPQTDYSTETEKAVSAALDACRTARRGPRELMRRRLTADLSRFVTSDAAAGEGFVPAHFEVAFGMPAGEEADEELSTEEPARVDLGTEFLFRGRIDRIDARRDGSARIIDYKSGGSRTVGGRADFQRQIYLLSAQNVFEGYRFVSSLFAFVTSKGDFDRKEISARDCESAKGDLSRRLGAVLEGIDAGRFYQFPDPGRYGGCRWCDASLACGAGCDILFAMKRSDAEANDFIGRLQGDG